MKKLLTLALAAALWSATGFAATAADGAARADGRSAETPIAIVTRALVASKSRTASSDALAEDVLAEATPAIVERKLPPVATPPAKAAEPTAKPGETTAQKAADSAAASASAAARAPEPRGRPIVVRWWPDRRPVTPEGLLHDFDRSTQARLDAARVRLDDSARFPARPVR